MSADHDKAKDDLIYHLTGDSQRLRDKIKEMANCISVLEQENERLIQYIKEQCPIPK